jgi:cytochrome c biogenesis protein CcdA
MTVTAAALGLAFSAGALASVNPCGFALLPAMVSFYLGQADDGYTARSLWRRAGEGLALGALVTAGFLLVFVLAGVLVSAGAGSLARVFPWATVVVGAGLIVLGLWLYLGGSLSVRVPHLQPEQVAGSYRAMFVYGVAYALASLGCTLPIFLIAVGAALAAGPVGSLVLFVAYSLGMGLVLTAVALGSALFRGIVARSLRRVLPYVQQVSALLLVVAGIYLLWTDLPRVLA